MIKAQNLKQLIVLTVLSLQTHVLHAQEACTDIFTSQYSLNGFVEKKAAANTILNANDFEKVLTDVNSLAGSLKIPSQVKVTIDDSFDTSHFSFTDYTIQVGIKKQKYPSGKSAHPKEILPALAHEYGHAVFERNLEENKAYVDLRNEYMMSRKIFNAVVAEFDKNLTQIKYQKDVAFTEKRKQELAIKETQLINSFEQFKMRVIYLNTLWTMRRAFHEFFADITAIASTRDPHAISEILIDLEKQNSRKDIVHRNFEMDRPQYLEKWLKAEPNIIKNSDQYSAMLPLRWEFWSLVKKRIKSDNYQKEIIPKVYEILSRHYNAMLADSPDNVSKYSFTNIEKINNDILNDLTVALSK